MALIIVLVLAGLGLPIPEDVPLIFSGYLCNKHYSPITSVIPANPGESEQDNSGSDMDNSDESIPPLDITARTPHIFLMMLAGMIGVLAGDSVVFSIGRRGVTGTSFVARHLQKVLHSKRREKVERHFARHGNWTVFAGRFFPGARSIVFAFAGMSRMSYLRFLAIDGMAAAISVPLFIFVGFRFAGKIESIFHSIDHVRHIVIPIVAVLAIGGLALWLVRRRRAAQAAVHQN
ncbi:MAG TPA: DedA family protein [Phycisphaerae bacterium]|nr:DedA family protein [Phycisphaerae bacterium]